MIKNYFKIALRNFKQHKLFTFINVIGLSIGISTALVIFLIVNYDFTFDKFHKDSDRIYRVVTNYSFAGEAGYNGGVTGPLPDAVKNEVTGLSQSAPIFTGNYNVLIKEGNKTPQRFKNEGGIVFTDGRYFDIFQYQWLLGSPKNSLNGPNQVVLTSLQAKKYFPHLSYGEMLGKQVIYEDTIKTTVTGVVQEFTENSDLTFRAFVSRETMRTVKDLKQELEGWGGTTSNSQFFVRLAPGKTTTSIEKQMNALLKKNHPPKPEDKGSTQDFHLQPLKDLHFDERYYAFDNPVSSKNTLYGLIAIAAFILILGCINFINLTTAQGSQRAKEIGIRKTMGGTRQQLIAMFLSETFLVTLFAVIISVGLCPLALKLFSDFIAKGVKFNILGQPGLIGFLLVLTVVVGFLSGFYPAMVLSGYKPALVIKNQAFGGKSKTRNAWLRKSLTVTQFIIAQFFIMATVLVSKQIYFALHKDLGFKKDAIGYVGTPWKVKSKELKQVFFNKIKALPQVELTSIGGDVPSSNGWSSNTVTYVDGKKEIKTELQIKSGDENYIKVYHIKLLTGRNVMLSDSSTSMIINNNYARILGFKNINDALGKSVSFGEKEKRQIVGVMADFHQGSLHAPIKPLAIFPQKWGMSTIHIALKPETPGGGEWKKAIASIEASWKELFPGEDFEFHFFDDNIANFTTKSNIFQPYLPGQRVYRYLSAALAYWGWPCTLPTCAPKKLACVRYSAHQ